MKNTDSAFVILGPLCDEVVKYSSEEAIRKLNTAIRSLPRDVIVEMQKFLLFPYLSKIKSSTLKSKYEIDKLLVDGMTYVIEQIEIKSFEYLEKILHSLFSIIFDNNQVGCVAKVPEELKLSTVEAIKTVILHTNEMLLPKIYKEPLKMMTVATIFICVNIAKNERLRTLQIASIECIKVISSTCSNNGSKSNDPDLENLIVSILRNILPGVLAALQDVATSQENQGHQVVCSALSTLSNILCLVMNDKYLPPISGMDTCDFAKLIDNKMSGKPDDRVRPGVPKPEENLEDWYSFANERLETVVKVLVPLQSHDHFKVRLELAVLAGRLLLECSRSMSKSLPHILNTLIILQEDPYEQVSTYCKTKLEEYFHSKPNTKYITVCCLSDNFFERLDQLPRVMNDIDSSKKNALLSLLRGYIELMDSDEHSNKLSQVMSVEANVRKLSTILLEVVSMDKSFISLLQDVGIRELSEDQSKPPWCHFRHIDSKETLERLEKLLKSLGSSECCESIVLCLLIMLREDWDKASEIVFLVNSFCRATSKHSLLSRVIETYTDSEIWYLPIEIGNIEEPVTKDCTYDVEIYNPHSWDKDYVPGLYEGAVETRYTDITYAKPRVKKSDPNKCQSLAEAQSNMAVMCHLTEGLGILASSMKEQFEFFILKTIPLILERVGSPYNCLHECGKRCLNDVSRACRCSGPDELIRRNADYLTHHVSLKFKKSWQIIPALQILSVVMEYTDSRILSSLHPIFTDVLVKSLDNNQEQAVVAFLEVFLSFVRNVKKWFPPKVVDVQMTDDSDLKKDFDILDCLNLENETELDEPDDECANEYGKTAEEMFKEDLQKKMEEDPLDYDDRVTKGIRRQKRAAPARTNHRDRFEKMSKFYSLQKCKTKILSLQILNEGLIILEEFENELLPLVHQIWCTLVERFSESEHLVVTNRAFDLLYTMADLSKDFIRNRTVKEVLPGLCKFLNQSSRESYLKDKGSSYRMTHAYKLQVNLLSKMGSFCVNLELRDEVLMDLMESVSHYLCNKQPKPLQEHAVKCFKIFLDFDRGATWCYLRKLCNNDEVLEPPSVPEVSILNSIRGTPWKPKDNSYKTNINLIMK